LWKILLKHDHQDANAGEDGADEAIEDALTL
jgi:hypothetical protein